MRIPDTNSPPPPNTNEAPPRDEKERRLQELHDAADWVTLQRQVKTPGPIQTILHLIAKEQARVHGR